MTLGLFEQAWTANEPLGLRGSRAVVVQEGRHLCHEQGYDLHFAGGK